VSEVLELKGVLERAMPRNGNVKEIGHAHFTDSTRILTFTKRGSLWRYASGNLSWKMAYEVMVSEDPSFMPTDPETGRPRRDLLKCDASGKCTGFKQTSAGGYKPYKRELFVTDQQLKKWDKELSQRRGRF